MDCDCSHEIKRCLILGRKVMTNLDSILKSRYHFADSGPYSQCYGPSNSHVWIWELEHKEDWAPKNWCLWTVVLEKILGSPLDCKEIKLVSFKGTPPWIVIGRTDAEALILWPPGARSQLSGKDPDAGKNWRKKEEGVAEEEMVRQHHRLSGHKSEQIPWDSEGQGSLVCCSPWGHKEWGTT